MPSPCIAAEHLVKTFRVAERNPGLWGAVRGVVRRRHRLVRALDDVSFSIQPGERFLWTLCGDARRKVVLASTFGYGFVTELGNLHGRMKAGKAMLTVPAGAAPVAPALVDSDGDAILVCATSDGYLLAFPLADVPELTKGKGNKLVNVPPKRLKAGEEYMVGLAVMAPKQEILIWAGQRYLRMGMKDIEHFRGDRALELTRAFTEPELDVV